MFGRLRLHQLFDSNRVRARQLLCERLDCGGGLSPGVCVLQHHVAGCLHFGQLVSCALDGPEPVPAWFLLQLTLQPNRVRFRFLLCPRINLARHLRCWFCLYKLFIANHLRVGKLLPPGIHHPDQVRGGLVLQQSFFADKLQFNLLLPPGLNHPYDLRPGLRMHHSIVPDSVRSGQLVSQRNHGREPLPDGILLRQPIAQGHLFAG